MIKIELSTIEPQGMLFWQGKNDKEMSNYIALGIDNKHVSNNSKRSRIGVCSIAYGFDYTKLKYVMEYAIVIGQAMGK